MKKFHLILLTTLNMCWLDGQIMQAIAAPQNHREGDSITVTDLGQKPLLGYLEQPLGKIITIAGVVRQERSGAKSSPRDVLSVEVVNDRPLAQPVLIEFNLFMTAQVAKPVLGRPFKYVGYETGGFSGVPAEAFKYVPAVSTTSHHFHTFFQVLHEELDIVKTKSDLMQFNDRRVQVIGRYVSRTRPAPAITSSIDFKGNYITANIVLEDGTEVPIFPTYNKQSLRSLAEVKAYDGKIVKVVGKINLDRDQQLNPDQRITLTTFDGIWQYQPTF
ncbi:hypothetical protein [Pseudanabaena sp. ABRG5-3]|uniref:hypothetical protein n=1 Tax=Pseudanabaena sp. ABRG5-3 TaxID=685565 RepID=UPI000DC741F8|nr:hypothetical protein [Pseudanabaena sp. ABRG5-3]BBC27021.1 hypothetical protein ABRG53_d056 [Pseudanabaena sp. ABRG5-3]